MKYLEDKRSILKLSQDLGSRCRIVAEQFLNDRKGVTAALQLGEASHANDKNDLYDMLGFDDEVNDLDLRSDGDRLERSFQMSLHLLLNK